MTVPLSILDLSPISEGSDAATALRNTVDLAQHAEQWGYKRYWIAEHHFVAVASSSPAVLIGQIAAATERIRVGAGAVQLGHTTAPSVVESFGMLDAFYPGRIDLGVGRSGQRRREAAKKPSAEPKPEARAADGMARRRRSGRAAAVRHADDHHRPTARADVGPAAARGGLAGLRRPGRRHPGHAARLLPGRATTTCTRCPASEPA